MGGVVHITQTALNFDPIRQSYMQVTKVCRLVYLALYICLICTKKQPHQPNSQFYEVNLFTLLVTFSDLVTNGPDGLANAQSQ